MYMKKVESRSKGCIGIDEVGRGPLAGPVTVCACYVEDKKTLKKDIFGNTIRDSKKLSKHIRNNIYITIRKKRKLETRIEYAISSRSAKYIDRYGINAAVDSCISSCLDKLKKKGIDITSTEIKLDAGLVVKEECLKQKSFIKGDERFVEIALASILAKVTRDKYMETLANSHIEYGWQRNVGYGTEEHRKAIKNNGITKYHRISYLKKFKQLEKPE